MSESDGSDLEPSLSPEVAAAIAVVVENLRVALGSTDRVRAALDSLDRWLVAGGSGVASFVAEQLLPLIGVRHTEVAALVFERFEQHVARFPHPLRILVGLLDVSNEQLQRRAALLGPQLAALGCAKTDPEAVEALAARCVELPGVFEHSPSMLALGALFGDSDENTRDLALGSLSRRRMVARILDAHGLPEHELARRILGRANADALKPYLEFTRATHLDLVVLTPRAAEDVPCLASLVEASRVLPQSDLAQLIGQLGWSRVCWGIGVQRVVGVGIEQGFPYRLDHDLAGLFDHDATTQRHFDRTLVVVEGDSGSGKPPAKTAKVLRFRRYNIAHAELLEALFEIAPLTRAKAELVLDRMAEVVEDFEYLFGDHTADGVGARDKYRLLRCQIESALHGEATEPQSSAVARLVQMFEEPRGVDEVTTLHGLKRYLHQRGLRLAFGLFGSASANRTVDVVVMEADRAPRVVPLLRYVDFELARGRLVPGPPLAVSLVIEAFTASLLHGASARLPKVEVLAYGNEVQIYLHYLSHPAFLRLDLSSPRDGGMLDLEYFAVSQTELEDHPNLELAAIRRLLTNLDFDVERNSLHLRVRYDKERATDLEDLVEHVRYLLAVTPYLMDLDWILARLDYPGSVRDEVVDAWTRYITHHTVLPVDLLLTAERSKIWKSAQPTPSGIAQVPWDGTPPYLDRYSLVDAEPLASRLERILQARGLDRLAAWGEARGRLEGQRLLERVILDPLRDAIARGELSVTSDGLVMADPLRFRREHEAVRLARLIAEGGASLQRAARVAQVVERRQRALVFQPTGAVQGRAVERAMLRLGCGRVGVFVLRDEAGVARIAVAADGGVLYEHRDRPSDPWRKSDELDPDVLADAWSADGVEADAFAPADLDHLRRLLLTERVADVTQRTSGDRIWPAVIAAPGRASGFVRFVNPRMSTTDAAGAVLVAPAFRPGHAPLLARAAGLVSTGGGILSHAGVTALALGTPALIVEAQWSEGLAPRLVRQQVRYAEEQFELDGLNVAVRREVGETLDAVEEGDLVVVDAHAGTLSILGQDPDALAIFRELGSLELAAAAIERAAASPEVLVERGRLLRCAHQLDKLLSRLTAPNVARFAVRALALPQASGDTRAVWPGVGLGERSHLLARLLANRACGQVASAELGRIDLAMRRQLEQFARDALAALPLATNVFQIAWPWLRVLRVRDALAQMNRLLASPRAVDLATPDLLAHAARDRLRALHHELLQELERGIRRVEVRPLRHTLQAFERTALLTGDHGLGAATVAQARKTLASAEAGQLASIERELVIASDRGGIELAPMIGAKAANLGEMALILGGAKVPRWVAVTNRALGQVLAEPMGRAGTLGAAIAEVLERSNSSAGRKADEIHSLWSQIKVPARVRAAIIDGYRQICAEGSEAIVAVRSSAFEEDSEQQPWAGQFATFLGVRGEDAVVEHVCRAWAALWSEPVLVRHQQLGLSRGVQVGSGVVLQRMVNARASGVLFTASPAAHAGQMILNVGLGLGEGIVSGLAEADLVIIERPRRPDAPLDLDYKAADKRHRVVLAADSLQRTQVADVSYHQRFRPALEFVEIQELVAVALKLEGALHHPIDVEFAIEGAELYVLQVRPVPVFHASLASPVLGRAVRGASEKGEPS